MRDYMNAIVLCIVRANNREHGARSGDDTEQSDVKVDVTIIGIGMRNNEKER